MNHLPAMTRSVTLALVVGALTGCINLDPKPDPTRYYVIDAETTADVKRAGECRRTILVGPVRVAGYADRPAIVERHGEHEIVQLGLHHWGEALSQALPRVITQRLAARLPEDCVSSYERVTPGEGALQIEIEVTRFELNGNDVASVAVSWRSFEPGNGSATGTHVVSAEVKFEASADRVAAGVSVLSMALDEVVGKIAAEVGDQALTR